jgi:hypothetical protein
MRATDVTGVGVLALDNYSCRAFSKKTQDPSFPVDFTLHQGGIETRAFFGYPGSSTGKKASQHAEISSAISSQALFVVFLI